MRQRCRELTKAAEALAIVIQLFGRKAGTMIKVNGRWRRLLAGIAHNQATRQKLGLSHVQIAVKALTQPARQADVIGVHVGANHAFDRLGCHEAGE